MSDNFGLSDNAVKIFKDLYSFQEENIEDTFKRVSREFATNKEEEDLAFKLLSEGYWRPNTPVFLNAGTKHKVFSACYVVGLEDSMDSIYDVANVCRKIFQYGAGVGIPIGNLREKQAWIYEGNKDKLPEGKSCLTGDTVLLNDKTNLSIDSQQITIKWLYDYYKNVSNPNYRVRSMLDDFGIGINTITDVIYNGKRPVYRIETKDGYKIKATSNHKFLSEDGNWKRVEDFSIKDKIGVNGKTRLTKEVYFDEIVNIEYIGIDDVYDIKMKAPYHNFIANGFISHNSGPITFMKLYDAVGESTKSGGRVRRAAILVSMPVWHPDIMDFIRCKETDGRLANMNISVLITDKFMQALEDKVPFDLISPYNGEKVSEIDPQELWEEISKMSWKSADPGVLFIDAMNRYNPLIKQMLINATNPCVTGETLVSTPNGYIRADSVKERDIIDTIIGNGKVDKLEINENYDIYEVEFSDGGKIKTTISHQFHAIKKGGNGTKKYQQIKLKDLEIGDWVRVSPTSLPNNKIECNKYGLSDYEYGLLIGTLIGDGCITEKSINKKSIKVASNQDDIKWNNVIENLIKKVGWNESIWIDKKYKSMTYNINGSSLMLEIINDLNIGGVFSYEKRIPFKIINSNENVLKGLIDGLISTDGNVNLCSTHPVIRYSTTSRGLIEDIRNIILMFGMHCSFGTSKNNRESIIDGRKIIGKTKYDLNISGASVKTFYEKFKISNLDKMKKLENAVLNFSLSGNTWKSKITSIKKIKEKAKFVYDLYESKSDTWITNGYVSRGCGEQPLWPFNACNLSAININKFARGVDDFDWDGLYDTTFKVMKLMDNLVDTMDFPDDDDILGRQRFRVNTLNNRPVGVGPMGLADAMYNLGYRYDGADGRKFAMEVMRIMTKACAMRSALIAKENGPFHNYEIFKEDMERIIEEHTGGDEEVMEAVKRYGVRNCQFTTCQPTGCLVGDTLISGKGFGVRKIENGEILSGSKTKSDNGECTYKNWYNQGIRKTKKVITSRGYEIQGTYDHKIRVVNENGYVWKRIDEITNNDFVVMRKNFIHDGIDKTVAWEREPVIFPYEISEFLGYYMADGWWTEDKSGHGRLYLSVNYKDEEYVDNLLYNLGKWFKFNISKRETEGNCFKYDIPCTDMYINFFRKMNAVKNGSENAFIPDFILQSSRETIFKFIKGYFNGDGCVTTRDREIIFTTVSKVMAKQLHTILLGLGYPSKLKTYEVKEGQTIEICGRELNCNHNVYKICVNNYYSHFLGEKIGVYVERNISKNNKEKVIITDEESNHIRYNKLFDNKYISHDKYIQNFEKNWFFENNLMLEEVKGVVDCNDELVYDMEIEEKGHTYVANGFVTHNTTALSCDSSYGIEPIMGLSFQKNLISGDRMMVVNPVLEERFKNEDWYSEDLPDKIFKNGGSLKGLRGIPKEVKNVFVTAHDIKYKDRIDMQAALQKYCSTAISSTVNLSKETTYQEMADLYEYAYKRGLKGITVYRDGSKKNQPVTFSKEIKVKEFDRPKVLNAKTHCVETGNGKMYVTVSHHEGKPLELFIFLGKSGQILNTLTEAMGRVISIGLQQGVPVEEITKTLININSDRMVWYRFEDTDQRPTQILSIPDGVAKLLDRYYTGVKYNGELGGEICEKCGNFMTAMEGCFNCPACGHSKCS